jgi:hypothetical protein
MIQLDGLQFKCQRALGVVGVTQVEECPFSKHKALNSNPRSMEGGEGGEVVVSRLDSLPIKL